MVQELANKQHRQGKNQGHFTHQPTRRYQFPNGFAPPLGGKPLKDSCYSGMISQRYIRLDYWRKTPWWGSSFKREEAAKKPF